MVGKLNTKINAKKLLRKLLIYVALLICFYNHKAKATHIVGGEFSMLHDTLNNYVLTLQIYFDDVNGSPGAEDRNAFVFIYEKGGKNPIDSFVLPRARGTQFVPYTNPVCAVPFLRTRVIIYRRLVTLDTGKYKSEAGYYLVWERCCRNGNITNIVVPGQTGQTFYLEFPALVKNGQRFLNSSPNLFPPLSDYGCVGRPFRFSFAGVDKDGDSLVYELTAPLKGNSDTNSIAPRPKPAPYAPVVWQTGFSNAVPITGNPSLGIDRTTGELTIIPDVAGLFVFAVKCREFRNGVEIGVVNREFQMAILDCPDNKAPQVRVRRPDDEPNDTIPESDTVVIRGSVDRCLTVRITTRFAVGQNQKQVRLIPKAINFTPTSPLVSPMIVTLSRARPIDSVRMCFPRCEAVNTGVPLGISLTAIDDGCPLGDTATVSVYALVEPPPSKKPVLEILNLTKDSLESLPGQAYNIEILGYDSLGEEVQIEGYRESLTNRPFLMSSVRAGQIRLNNQIGRVCDDANKGWIPYFFLLTNFPCGTIQKDTAIIWVKVIDPSAPSEVLWNGIENLTTDKVLNISVRPGDDLRFIVRGIDTTAMPINLNFDSSGLSPRLADILWQQNFDSTNNAVSGSLKWIASCKDLALLPEFFSLKATIQNGLCPPYYFRRISLNFDFRDTLGAFVQVPNVITPNADGFNDALVWDLLLPPNNCSGEFIGIKLFNRWGQQVYSSVERDKFWDGNNLPSGSYFYELSYTNKKMKGWIELVY